MSPRTQTKPPGRPAWGFILRMQAHSADVRTLRMQAHYADAIAP